MTRKRRLLPPIAAMVLVLVVFWGFAGLAVIVDPLDLYSWGPTPRLAEDDTPRSLAFLLTNAVAKSSRYDSVLVGSSPTQMYTPRRLKRLLPDVGEIANLSQAAARPRSRDLVLKRLLHAPRVRRVIVTLDWIYSLSPGTTSPNFPTFLYDGSRVNDLRAVNLETVRREALRLTGTTYGSAARYAAQEKTFEKQYRKFQKPRSMRVLRAAIDKYRPTVATPTRRTCADFPTLSRQLVPFVHAFTGRGGSVDVVIPVYNPSWFYIGREKVGFGPTAMNDEIAMRRCAVRALATLPRVRIFAFDGEPWVGDLANFRDAGHLHTPSLQDEVFASVAENRHRLTLDNIDAYSRQLRVAIETYHVFNSNVRERRSNDS